jgi:IS30 family transposase
MKSTAGRPRALTDEQVASVLEWNRTRKSLVQLARELGVCTTTIENAIRCDGQYKQPSAELRPEAVRARRARFKALDAGGWLTSEYRAES